MRVVACAAWDAVCYSAVLWYKQCGYPLLQTEKRIHRVYEGEEAQHGRSRLVWSLLLLPVSVSAVAMLLLGHLLRLGLSCLSPFLLFGYRLRHDGHTSFGADSLGDNSVGSDGARAIAEMLKDNTVVALLRYV